MSISSTTNRNDYTGNGATNTYSYTFRITVNDQLLVTVADTDNVETTLTLTTDYTVTGVGSSSGGTIVLVNASQAWLTSGNLITDYSITIRRVVDVVQETDIRNQGSFYPETHEDALDYITFICQQQQDELDRSIKLAETSDPADFSTTIPAALVGAASTTLITNATGDGFSVGPTAGQITSAQTYATNAASSASAAATSATSAASSATSAAASATAAQDAVDSVIWRDVDFKVYADSPITIASSDKGKLFAVDTSGGNVSITLPEIATLDLTDPWAVGVKKTSSDSNSITINRSSTDTINGGTSETLDTQGGGFVFIPDTDPSPDEWTGQAFGVIEDGSVTTAKLADDAVTRAKLASGAVAERTVRSVTTTDTCTNADDLLVLSGASFTQTLYTAVGNTGREIELLHQGTDLTQVYTLATTSSQTIGGIASGSYVLRTNGERLKLISDGSNWLILEHYAETGWNSAGSGLSITATTTSPTKATTTVIDNYYWKRSGDTVHIRYNYSHSSSTGSAAGSGDYLFNMPSNMTIDTNYVDTYSTLEGWNSSYLGDYRVGSASAADGGGTMFRGSVVPYSSTELRCFGAQLIQAGVIGSAGYPLSGSSTFYSLDFIVPISGWQP